MKIKIDNEFSEYLESLSYEVNARMSLCKFLIANGLGKTDDFNYYHDQYVELYTEYELAKKELESKYIRPQVNFSNFTWNLDFSNCEVEVNEF